MRAPATAQELTTLESSISIAEQEGAANDPRAAQHLQGARDQLAQSRQLAQQGDHGQAHRLRERAAVDAELAAALGREHRLRAEAEAQQAQLAAVEAGVAPPSPGSTPTTTPTTTQPRPETTP
ncbi:MAG: DUF4398 domain-containing protein [Myxococcota bacterium]|nr:DUF4398 domain-containing protein [Myxococcota bacterium]